MIEVVTRSYPDESWKFDSVTKWHVDNDGHLHLQYPDRGGNAATFANGEWVAVYDSTTDPAAEQAERIAQAVNSAASRARRNSKRGA